MSRADEYRQNAFVCVRRANALMEGRAKARLIDMARAWHSLADQAERNSKADLVYEPAPVRADAQSIVQQQQQIQPLKIQPPKA